ncbi:carboxypeptidase N subunit 2-like [Anopheles albimanus]|uniref:carboxypeptidase N subunit 2-like n=1 Tax=Anopheles albimanus TaxID=7167 RepID=UPI00164140A0|nr:carboxypeptidase N subunit 2-like [Anopheles albimanus]
MTSDGGPRLRRAIDNSEDNLWSVIIDRLIVASAASGPFLQRIGAFTRSLSFLKYHDAVFQLPADTIIEGVFITDASPLRSFVAARNQYLQTLHIDKCSLDRIPTTLANMPVLNILVIRECALSVVRMDAFAGTSALQSVALDENKIRQLLPATSNPTTFLPIREFSIESNLLERVDMAVFASMPELEVLSLRNNRIVALQATLPVTLANLVRFRFEINAISSIELGQLTLPTLAMLMLDQNAFSEMPTNWPKMPELKLLSIEETNLKEANLTSLRVFPKLRSLYLGVNQITTFQVMEPVRLSALEFFSLSKNKLTSVNFSKLHVPLIYFIDLAYNQLKTIPPLFQRYPNVTLSVFNNPLTCSAIQPFKSRIVTKRLYGDSVWGNEPCQTTSFIVIDEEEKLCCNA